MVIPNYTNIEQPPTQEHSGQNMSTLEDLPMQDLLNLNPKRQALNPKPVKPKPYTL